MQHLTKENLNFRCRTCLNEYKTVKYDLKKVKNFAFFKHSDLLKKKDGYPNYLCSDCYDILQNFEQFRRMSEESRQFLDNILSSKEPKANSKQTKNVACKVNTTKEMGGNSIDTTLEESTLLSSTSPKNYNIKNNLNVLNSFEEILFEDIDSNCKAFDKLENVLPFHNEVNIDLEDNFSIFSETTEKSTATPSPLRETIDLETSNGKYSTKHECSTCKRCLSSKFRLQRHMKEYHSEKPTIIVCRFEGCGKTFHHQETATSHYRLKHTIVAKTLPKDVKFICEDCGRIFKSMANLREHRYQHAPAEARPFKCTECEKCFISKRSYNEHLMRHAGIKKYECPYCDIKKTSVRELRAHINYHTKEKQWQCPHCPRVFNRAANLSMHDKVVHKRIRQYVCQYCQQSFGKPDTLKHHIMRHTGERPHRCKICNRGFIQPTALRTHMKTHGNFEKSLEDEKNEIEV